MTIIYEVRSGSDVVLRTTDRAEAESILAWYQTNIKYEASSLRQWTPTVGQCVVWLLRRGGYAWVRPVPVTILEIRGERVRIQVDSEPTVKRWVSAHNLKERA